MLLQPSEGRCCRSDEPPITLLLFASAREKVHPEIVEPVSPHRHKSRRNDNLMPARHGPGKSSKCDEGAPANRAESARVGGRQDQLPHAAKPTAPLVTVDGHRQLHPEQFEGHTEPMRRRDWGERLPAPLVS